LACALSFALLLALLPALLHGLRGESADAASAPAATPTATAEPPAQAVPAPAGASPNWPFVVWRSSRALGRPTAGRLVHGVQLPVEGPDFFTWDAVHERSPNPGWRRYGTDRLVRTLLGVLADFHAAHPEAPRVGVGDLSRRQGGEFGARFGGLGHASHQNGLDVDVYYPRRDLRERDPLRPRQIDGDLAQDLVDRFVRAGAQFVFVGPRTGLRGASRVVQPLVHHDDHMHVRLRRR
jgi:murein endopeptidase